MSTTTSQATAPRTSLNYPAEQPPSDSVAADVLVAVWCRSVGAYWTLELYQLEGDTTPRIITDWITSGVPISQPAPDALVDDLLADRGLELFRDPSAGPCTHNRHGIGYVSTNSEVIRQAAETRTHPVALATQIMPDISPTPPRDRCDTGPAAPPAPRHR